MFVDISEKNDNGVDREFYIILTCLILVKPQGISIIIFTLWLRKLWLREVKWFCPRSHSSEALRFTARAGEPRFPARREPGFLPCSCQDSQAFGSFCLFVCYTWGPQRGAKMSDLLHSNCLPLISTGLESASQWHMRMQPETQFMVWLAAGRCECC